MGTIKYSLIIIVFSMVGCSQNEPEENHGELQLEAQNEDTTLVAAFDSVYAASLGADDYGMRKYVMAFLRKGPNRDQDDSTRANLQRAHLDNITRLAEEGVLVLAGPFFDEGDIRGIYLFAVDSISQAKELTETDPAIQSGSLTMELHEWYGSAAIMEINEIHKRIAKINI